MLVLQGAEAIHHQCLGDFLKYRQSHCKPSTSSSLGPPFHGAHERSTVAVLLLTKLELSYHGIPRSRALYLYVLRLLSESCTGESNRRRSW